jgi:CRISPR-associated endonuclease/helicase Cas3
VLDVAAVAFAVLETIPEAAKARLADALSASEFNGAARWIAAVVGLHDLGKAVPGFQAKWPEGRRRAEAAGFDFPTGAPDRHDAATLPLLREALKGRGIDRRTAGLLASAVAAHHGFPIPATESEPFIPSNSGYSEAWLSAHRFVSESVFKAVNVQEIPIVESTSGLTWEWLAGLCAFSDWIGSSELYFPHGRDFLSPPDTFSDSLVLARKALTAIGWSRPPIQSAGTASDPIALALPDGAVPRPLQSAVSHLLKGVSAPFLLVIEAPMGEGKTEAAFIADAHLAEGTHSRGVYFAMPTQATSNALFGRLAAYLERRGAGHIETIQLVHSGSNSHDAQLRLHEIGYGPVDSSVQTSIWFGGARKGLLAPNAVGTIDQALVGVLNAKHAFVRLFGLSDRVVVLDEVHAYDDYTGSLLERLVAWLAGLGCSVVVMSATLPVSKREGLLRAFGSKHPVPDIPYPRAVLVSNGSITDCCFEPARHQSVQVSVAPELTSDIATLAKSLADRGGCVLVVANTVDRSQAIFSALREMGAAKAVLFHARFPMSQRLKIERQILDRFGPNGARRDGAIVVATQVVEQSLDVDFDVLISDLAPVDLLLQRVGRLHRHARRRPAAHEMPVLYVAGLGNEGIPPRGPRAVYDAWPTFRTAALLRQLSTIQLPQDIDRLVQSVYEHGEIPVEGELAVAIDAANSEYRNLIEKQRHLAKLSALGDPNDWTGTPMSIPIDDEDAILAGGAGGTRLGEASITVIPVFDLGLRWSVAFDSDTSWDKQEDIPDKTAKMLAEHILRISNKAAIRLARSMEAPRGWKAKRALAWIYPLVLNADGLARDEYVEVRLDPILGLVYARQ